VSAQNRIREFLQELENEGKEGDLVTSFVIIAKCAMRSDLDSTAYQHYWSGSIDERLGLLRYAQLRMERMVSDMGAGE